MSSARSITPRTRFEVFKRDKFSCQYCGRKAPDVILNADHIHPVADGGTSDIMNLVTSCAECNGGKSDKLLADDAAVTKSRAQAEASEDRRQQNEMMANWQVELAALEPEIAAVNAMISKLAKHALTDTGIKTTRSLVRKFGLEEVLQSIAVSFDRYGSEDYWSKVTTILRYRKAERDDPDRAALLRTYNGIVSGLPYHPVNYNHCRRVIEGWKEAGHDAQAMLRSIQEHAKWWGRFRDAVSDMDEAVH